MVWFGRDKVISSDGKDTGVRTGGERPCQMEGCRGHRYAVRWEDGKLTYPCTQGMTMVDDHTWRIM